MVSARSYRPTRSFEPCYSPRAGDSTLNKGGQAGAQRTARVEGHGLPRSRPRVSWSDMLIAGRERGDAEKYTRDVAMLLAAVVLRDMLFGAQPGGR